ncbi:acetolactate synthase small subunit [Candidatus Bipolaricaulota bacterium]|nr:acetolactate synthase small subunit [Candidatus Bipolaricaulota bacterium]
MKRTLVAWVEDKPGALNRIVSLFRRRVFNIASLTVGSTERPGISRMTIVLDSGRTSSERLAGHLRKLVNVLRVEDVTDCPAVLHDLAVVKVQTEKETRGHVMQVAFASGARVVDVGPRSVTVETTGTEESVDSLVAQLQPFGIAEMVRTGRVAMLRDDAPSSWKE